MNEIDATAEAKSLDDFFESAEPAKVKIHRAAGDDSVCVSCEG